MNEIASLSSNNYARITVAFLHHVKLDELTVDKTKRLIDSEGNSTFYLLQLGSISICRRTHDHNTTSLIVWEATTSRICCPVDIIPKRMDDGREEDILRNSLARAAIIILGTVKATNLSSPMGIMEKMMMTRQKNCLENQKKKKTAQKQKSLEKKMTTNQSQQLQHSCKKALGLSGRIWHRGLPAQYSMLLLHAFTSHQILR